MIVDGSLSHTMKRHATALRKERKRDTIFESLSVITLGSADCLFISKSSSLDLEFDTHQVRPGSVVLPRAAFFFG